VIELLQEHYTSQALPILIPGAGLGRLGYDVAQAGNWEVHVNECSPSFLQTLDYILNRATEALPVHVYGSDFQNTAYLDPAAASLIPGLLPSTLAPLDKPIVILEGDFIQLFNAKTKEDRNGNEGGLYGAVLTVFFIDVAAGTTHNSSLLDVLRTIDRILAPGGVWIHAGPLNYGMNDHGPLLSWDEIRALFESWGYHFLANERQHLDYEVPALGPRMDYRTFQSAVIAAAVKPAHQR